MQPMTVRISVFEAICALVAAKLPTVEVDDVSLDIDEDGCVVVDLVPLHVEPPKPAKIPTLDDVLTREAYVTTAPRGAPPSLPKAGRIGTREPEPEPEEEEEEEEEAPELQASTSRRRDRPWFRPVPMPAGVARVRQEE